MQLAGVRLSEITKKCELNHGNFLRANFESKKIRDSLSEPNFNILVGVLFANLCVLAGVKEALDQATKADLYRNLKNYNSDLTIEEIYKAFELERYGEYSKKSNHFQLFGTDYFSEVVKKYRQWKIDTLTSLNITLKKTIIPPEMSDIQKKEQLSGGIIRIFEEYKRTKNIDDPCAHLFDELLDRGLILGANTEGRINYYNQKKEQASKELEAEIDYKISTSDSLERKSLKRVLNTIQDKSSNSIIIRTKKIVLKEYFEKLILENKDITNLLNKQNEND